MSISAKCIRISINAASLFTHRDLHLQRSPDKYDNSLVFQVIPPNWKSNCSSWKALSKVFWDQFDPIKRLPVIVSKRTAENGQSPLFECIFGTQKWVWSLKTQNQICRALQGLTNEICFTELVRANQKIFVPLSRRFSCCRMSVECCMQLTH